MYSFFYYKQLVWLSLNFVRLRSLLKNMLRFLELKKLIGKTFKKFLNKLCEVQSTNSLRIGRFENNFFFISNISVRTELQFCLHVSK